MKLALIALFVTYVAASLSSEFGSTACRECHNGLQINIARVVWTTLETGMRGFLLGFGSAILKDVFARGVLNESDDVQAQFKKTLHFARIAGYGSASFLVGIAILMPARWRYEYMRV